MQQTYGNSVCQTQLHSFLGWPVKASIHNPYLTNDSFAQFRLIFADASISPTPSQFCEMACFMGNSIVKPSHTHTHTREDPILRWRLHHANDGPSQAIDSGKGSLKEQDPTRLVDSARHANAMDARPAVFLQVAATLESNPIFKFQVAWVAADLAQRCTMQRASRIGCCRTFVTNVGSRQSMSTFAYKVCVSEQTLNLAALHTWAHGACFHG